MGYDLFVSNFVMFDEFSNGFFKRLVLGSKVFKLRSKFCDGGGY